MDNQAICGRVVKREGHHDEAVDPSRDRQAREPADASRRRVYVVDGQLVGRIAQRTGNATKARYEGRKCEEWGKYADAPVHFSGARCGFCLGDEAQRVDRLMHPGPCAFIDAFRGVQDRAETVAMLTPAFRATS